MENWMERGRYRRCRRHHVFYTTKEASYKYQVLGANATKIPKWRHIHRQNTHTQTLFLSFIQSEIQAKEIKHSDCVLQAILSRWLDMNISKQTECVNRVSFVSKWTDPRWWWTVVEREIKSASHGIIRIRFIIMCMRIHTSTFQTGTNKPERLSLRFNDVWYAGLWCVVVWSKQLDCGMEQRE